MRQESPLSSASKYLVQAWPALMDLASGGPPANAVLRRHPLWGLYAPIAQGVGVPAFVVAQLGQSLDGRIATTTGKSRNINGREAIRHLHRLRALVDAVVVGVGTVIADDPQLNVREVAGPCPARVIIDPNFRMPSESRLLSDEAGPVFTIQSRERARPAGVTPILVPARDGWIAPTDIVTALTERASGGSSSRAAPPPFRPFLPPGRFIVCTSASPLW